MIFLKISPRFNTKQTDGGFFVQLIIIGRLRNVYKSVSLPNDRLNELTRTRIT